MASLRIGRARKPREDYAPLQRERTERSEERSKCPVFNVQYLGKLPARGEYGREYISDPVECLQKMKDKQRLPKTTLTVSEKGFHFLDQNGPFGKEKHVLIPLHNICYGVADEKSPHVFAIITRTGSNSDSNLLECHAFLCDKRKTSSEITYWLLRTFLQVFEDLQKKRRLRQERKLLRRQHGGGGGREFALGTSDNVRESNNKSRYYPESGSAKPFESGSYSVILEGSKGHGASVGLTMDRSKSRHGNSGNGQIDTAHGNARGTERDVSGRDCNDNIHNPVINTNADVHSPTLQVPSHHRQQHRHLIPSRNTYSYIGIPSQAGDLQFALQQPDNDRAIMPQSQTQMPVANNSRYTKNQQHSPQASSRGTDFERLRPSIHDESDFLFIDLLQEEFTDGRQTIESAFSVRSGRMGKAIGPPNQKLRNEDIERRIREWLSARDESNDVISVLGGDETQSSPIHIRRRWSNGDAISVSSSDAYF